ncbi:NADP-dependent dehydrogenase-like protein [Chaetomium strumarium]|uniref:NADP-dependent dehydrogenase-like protein n=1 Tax=Chaetomium strumarium TaxID=1170767 RepID=A0AAJ0H0T6_9PEZI|nr:NADP-dependent dehydrogenase-like protein [Chaetomium strumarium]
MPVYVITGARTGIGLEYVRQLSRAVPPQSNTIFAVVRKLDSDLTALRAVQSSVPNPETKVHIVECDISSPASIAALPDRIRNANPSNPAAEIRIDTLINNAATLHSREETALSLTPSALQSHIASNVLGPALVLQALLPLLSPRAKVANVSSGIASMALVRDGSIKAEITPYSVSKAALNMLTVHQARQLRGIDAYKEVVVVAVDPGHVKTEMGGPNAVVEVADSASGVLKVLEGLGVKDTGRFLLYTGAELPW